MSKSQSLRRALGGETTGVLDGGVWVSTGRIRLFETATTTAWVRAACLETVWVAMLVGKNGNLDNDWRGRNERDGNNGETKKYRRNGRVTSASQRGRRVCMRRTESARVKLSRANAASKTARQVLFSECLPKAKRGRSEERRVYATTGRRASAVVAGGGGWAKYGSARRGRNARSGGRGEVRRGRRCRMRSSESAVGG